jgi:TolB-like protein
MPFVNESGNIEIEYLSDGMTETLIGYLSQLPDLDVKARSSVFRYKGKETNAQTIGKELNVQAILTGRLIQRGQDLTLYTELVDAKKETVLWSEDYKQPMASLLSLQSEITRDVVQKLKTRLSGAEEQKLAKNYTANSEAYQLYLKGRYYWNKRTAKDVDKSIEYYQQAITVDPNYALAYAGLADSYTTSYTSSLGRIPSLERMIKGREAAVKALALDDNLAEAHTAFGRVLTVFDYDFKVAEREFRRAIALNPAYAVTYERYAFVLAYQSRWEEALFHVRRAVDIEPLNLSFSNTYGLLLMLARRYDEAIAQLKKTLELDPNFQLTHNVLSIAYWLKGDYAQSVEERAKTLELNGDVQKAAQVRESYAKGGWSEFLRLVVREAITFSTPFYNLATYYAALGEKDNAFAALNKALENRETLIATIKIDPRLDPLRNDPRFQQLVQRVGFK